MKKIIKLLFLLFSSQLIKAQTWPATATVTPCNIVSDGDCESFFGPCTNLINNSNIPNINYSCFWKPPPIINVYGLWQGTSFGPHHSD